MKGKTVIITGANAGIGKAAATELASMGARVVMTARNPQKGAAALAEVKQVSGNHDVELLLSDFSSLAQVRSLAEQILERCPKIDVLVHNAGLILQDRQVTEDGHEFQFQVNHLAPFLLTSLLRERLIASAPARVVVTSSEAHVGARTGLDFDDLMLETTGYASFKAYCRSKLANILFARELAKQLEGTGVTANALHPGMVRTGFGARDDMGCIFGTLIQLFGPFMLSAGGGARTTIHLASSPAVEGITGEYWAKRKIKRVKPWGRDDEAAKRLWTVSEELVGL
jgi:NAD(P)-dependent dehydrogenase (short-subunit alcohol dehydrogenase family)